ncbi:MAG: hypothetical protein FJ276_27320 [Planctomycetes bacterium]|nr:hypothetical protein [Planctomycetota bacterium]
MNARIRILAVGLFGLFAVGSRLAAQEPGAEKGLAKQLSAAAKRAVQAKQLLRYQFQPGESLQWQVTHLVTVETTIKGNTQTAKTSSKSTKVWTVKDVDEAGNVTFVYSVSRINMWRKVSGSDEMRYDSEVDENPPLEYAHVASTVGVPLASVTVSPSGRVIQRDDIPQPTNTGLGQIIRPLPEEPVEVGDSWRTTDEIHVRNQNGEVSRIKTRLVYTLKSYKAGVATISVKTEVLTPVEDPRIKSQLVQQVTNGEIKFDNDAGRILSQQIDWDDTVLGFNGPDSSMKHLARFTEELIPAGATAQKPSEGVR